MHSRQTKNETPTLVPDLNRGTNAGMDRVDRTRSQDLIRIIGRDCGTSQAHL